MSQNALPSGIHDLLKRARGLLHGLETHGPWLDLGAVSAGKFRPMLEELGAAEMDFSRARSAKGAAGVRAAAADEALTAWLGKARLVVMLALGSQWSLEWVEAGFAEQATCVPKDVAGRMGLGRALVEYLRRHGEMEVAFAEVTVARGEALNAEMEAARMALCDATVDAAGKKRRRDAAESALRGEMRRVIIFLELAIGGADVRWGAFGLNPPRPDARRIPVPKRPGEPPGAVIAWPPPERPGAVEGAVAA